MDRAGNHISRIQIAALVLTFSFLLSSARLLLDARKATDPNKVAWRSDLRFAELKAALPPQGVVGYIGDPAASPGEYYLTGYALAPVVVDYSSNHALVIGNFPKGVPSAELLGNLELLQNFGNGVLLFANRGAR